MPRKPRLRPRQPPACARPVPGRAGIHPRPLQTWAQPWHNRPPFINLPTPGGRSSVGRAVDCGSTGRGFKSRRSPQFSLFFRLIQPFKGYPLSLEGVKYPEVPPSAPKKWTQSGHPLGLDRSLQLDSEQFYQMSFSLPNKTKSFLYCFFSASTSIFASIKAPIRA